MKVLSFLIMLAISLCNFIKRPDNKFSIRELIPQNNHNNLSQQNLISKQYEEIIFLKQNIDELHEIIKQINLKNTKDIDRLNFLEQEYYNKIRRTIHDK